MPLYEFRCPRCGVFEAQHSMSAVPAERQCRTCVETATRIFSPVGLSKLGTARATAMSEAERSAHEPDVVTRLPGPPVPKAPPHTSHDPRHLKLPRP
ncbi:FmdB family zinc ribbon protein [Kocuria sp. TGY1127_2]|uniref:FmdB family zinc ribbon protein n=1 Tax=Kocuria sp. TGY1127_2 TaxID=2711328 RepID=UPI0015C0A13F|nr:FmdB family zinc ribbon protein [Kocuria sp. TGY1127_2]